MARKQGLIKAEKAPRTIYTDCGIEPCEVLTDFATFDEFLASLDKAVPTLQEMVDQITPENRYPEVSTGPEISQEVIRMNPNNIGSTFDSWLREEGICEDAPVRAISGTAFLFTETGTEGGYWAVQENGKRGYEGLQILDDGDDLTVYAKDGSVLWHGIIHQDTQMGRRPRQVIVDGQIVDSNEWEQQVVGGFWVHWVQAGMDPETWGKLFMGKKRCLLKPKRRIE